MSDYIPLLLKDPTGALKMIKPTNPLLKDIFQAICTQYQIQAQLPNRGLFIKQW
jgi:hypothetical protein